MLIIEFISNLAVFSLALFNSGIQNIDRDSMADYLSALAIARSGR